ncbi:uncharacterized protein LOC143601077 [Bidens hawaiensis]|uniref:uncharacterized protein LOC143601077 n=1 Tax=Bidens hawaiensis TaxID=980011 RepID=UPI00404B131E
MKNLEHIWPCRISNSEKNDVCMLRQIIVTECSNLVNIFPCNPLPLLNHLEEVVVKKCGSIEVLFNIDIEVYGIAECHSSRLRRIEAYELEKLKDLWRMIGVNNSRILINCFKGVEIIEIKFCKRFTNIFTPTTTSFDLGALTTFISHENGRDLGERDRENKLLFKSGQENNVAYPSHLLNMCEHLQTLELHDDKRVQEVVFDIESRSSRQLATVQDSHPPLLLPYLEKVMSSRDDKNEENARSTFSHKSTTFFPHLDTLKLERLSCLKSIDGGDTLSRSGKVSSNSIHDQIQSGDQVIGSCSLLCQYPRKISICDCDALLSLIPWYAVGQMQRLQELEIQACSRMIEIFECDSVNNTNNVGEGSAHGGACTTLTSPTLKVITNVLVPQLSNLKRVLITNCNRLSHIFTFSAVESLRQLNVFRVTKCKALQVIVKEENGASSKVIVFPRLKTLELNDLPKLKAFFLGKNEFRCPLLEDLKINHCPQFMTFTTGQSITPKLKYIHTSLGKHSLERGFNFQTTYPTSSNLTILKGMPCFFHELIKLVMESPKDKAVIPSNALLQLQKLETIDIDSSYFVEEVFEVALEETNDSGVNESQAVVIITNLRRMDLKFLHNFNLVQLQELYISDCWYTKVIVKKEEKHDAKVNEIILPRLKYIKLYDLPSLEGFYLGNKTYSLLALDTLEIKRCPKVKDFTNGRLSTPELRVIDKTFGMCHVKTDINSFIKNKQGEIALTTNNSSSTTYNL